MNPEQLFLPFGKAIRAAIQVVRAAEANASRSGDAMHRAEVKREGAGEAVEQSDGGPAESSTMTPRFHVGRPASPEESRAPEHPSTPIKVDAPPEFRGESPFPGTLVPPIPPAVRPVRLVPPERPAKSAPEEQAVIYRRNERARRYVLRVDRQGQVLVTIPRRGTQKQAEEFVAERHAWIKRQTERRAATGQAEQERRARQVIFFRGREVEFRIAGEGNGRALEIDGELFPCRPLHAEDPRQTAERGLQRLAGAELPARTWELARAHNVPIRRVTVRGQRSRWGSCSAKGTISLNWKLVQAPDYVRDYLILHELMHRREMNHSARYWRHVESVCPDYRTAEEWLRKHGFLLEQGVV